MEEPKKPQISTSKSGEVRKPAPDPVSKLGEAIEQAKRADGYMILISRLNGDKLTHVQFMRTFRKGDIMPSLDELAKLLEPEVQ